jgi:peptidoglycan/LPS O-acetylase OafA/YrhL
VSEARGPAAPQRLAFLDMARAVAALAVVANHVGEIAWPAFRIFGRDVFNPGVFGVITFFLVSGFIIPFSLERLGSVRRFAVSRFFRLYPLYWFSLAGVLVLYRLHLSHPPPVIVSGSRGDILWNVTMMQSFFGKGDAIGLYWTLACELVFYAAMSLLFAVGLSHRTLLVLYVGTAYVAVWFGLRPLLFDEGGFPLQIFWMLTFVAGTACFRAFSGEAPVKSVVRALVVYAVVIGLVAWLHFGHRAPETSETMMKPLASFTAWIAAYAFFFCALWLRDRHIPRVVSWLGRNSYSLYLIHGLLLQVALPVSPVAAAAIYVVATLLISEATYLFVERPAIDAGRALLRRGEPVATRRATG